MSILTCLVKICLKTKNVQIHTVPVCIFIKVFIILTDPMMDAFCNFLVTLAWSVSLMPNLLRCYSNGLEIVPKALTMIGRIWYEYLECNCCNSLTSSIYLSILVICLLLTLKSRGAHMSITVHFMSRLSQMIISGQLCFTLLTIVTG